jgi:EthD domain
MDKLLFFFRRKPGLTRAEFSEHYLDVHAPLGLRLTRTMAGYTVNLTDAVDDGGPDAVTEVWTESMADFFDPGRSFATPDDAAELMADHDSFIGPYDTYVVEERLVRDGGDAPSPGARTPGVKRIECFLDGEAVPPPGPDATRVVEHRVVQALNPDAPPYVAIVSTWAPTLDALGPSTATATLVREYRRLLPTT